jgi:hypothetical protein
MDKEEEEEGKFFHAKFFVLKIAISFIKGNSPKLRGREHDPVTVLTCYIS